MVVSGEKSHVSNRQNVSLKEPCIETRKKQPPQSPHFFQQALVFMKVSPKPSPATSEAPEKGHGFQQKLPPPGCKNKRKLLEHGAEGSQKVASSGQKAEPARALGRHPARTGSSRSRGRPDLVGSAVLPSAHLRPASFRKPLGRKTCCTAPTKSTANIETMQNKLAY